MVHVIRKEHFNAAHRLYRKDWTFEKNDAVFDFATIYYYKNPSLGAKVPQLTDADFSEFKTFLKKKNFSFDTETEKALKKTI